MKKQIATLLKHMARETVAGRFCVGFLQDVRGVAALEFALVSIPFLAILVASLEISIIYFADEALQTATWQSARYIMTGQASNLTQAQYTSVVCGYLPSIFSCGNIMVDVESSGSFATLTPNTLKPTWNAQGKVTNTWTYAPGAQGNAVIVRVMYPWPVVSAPLGWNPNNDGNGTGYLMTGTAVVLNEPWPTS